MTTRPIDEPRLLTSQIRSEAKTLTAMGKAFASGGRYEDAVRMFEDALQSEPAYAEAHQALGCRLGAMNRSSDAARHLQTAIQLDGDLLPARLCLAGVRFQQDRLEEATRLYRAVLEDQPSNSLALMGIADSALLLDRTEEAATYYRRALQSNPALPSASQNLSSALWRLGRYAASIDVLTQAVAASPDDGPLKTRLAWQLATGPDPRLRDGPRALALADSVRGSQRTLETIDATAAAYAEMGRFKEAVSTLRAGLALPQARTRTGQACLRKGLGIPTGTDLVVSRSQVRQGFRTTDFSHQDHSLDCAQSALGLWSDPSTCVHT